MTTYPIPIFFIGCVESSAVALRALMNRPEINIRGVLCMRHSTLNSDFVDLSKIASTSGISVHYAEDTSERALAKILADSEVELLFVIGWSRLLGPEILSIPPRGVVGFHPAKLPENRGRHPLIWALALGLEKTASTLFLVDEGADSGPILTQEEVSITLNDDAQSLYKKILAALPGQIDKVINDLLGGGLCGLPQDHSVSNDWRKRGRMDGLIDWRMSALAVYNLTRALTRPYVGAEFRYGQRFVKLWRCEVLTGYVPENAEPGKVLDVDYVGPVIKTGTGAEGGSVRLLEFEPYFRLQSGEYL